MDSEHNDGLTNDELYAHPVNIMEDLSDEISDEFLQELLCTVDYNDLVQIPGALVEEYLNNVSNTPLCDINQPSTSGTIQIGEGTAPLTFVNQTHIRSDFFNMDSYTDELKINQTPDEVSPSVMARTSVP